MRKYFLFNFLLLCLTSLSVQAQTLMPLPAHSAQFNGNVRGYWFTSPTCFTITGLEVPADAGTGAQSIAVVRLPAPPPTFATTTNIFTTLFLTQNNPAPGIIPVNIQVEQGDHIMILGQRGTINSYSAAGSFTATINGQTMAITRCGMQFSLSTTAPTQLWGQASGAISRTFMYYDSVLTFNITATPSGPSAYTFTNGSDSSFASVWDYGDGSPLDNVWNGAHTYAAGGVYTVCSYVTTSCGTDTVCNTITVCAPDPVSAFGAVSSGFDVQFTDSSSNAVSWLWDFGDGFTDTTANPFHTYGSIDWYYVCLTTTNNCGVSDTICDSIFVCIAPIASMGYQLIGSDTVAFIDSSAYASTWLWDFGDGGIDTTQNPVHVYTADGTYTVCLIISNPCGSDTVCTSITVCVTPLDASFASTLNLLTAQFSTTPSNFSYSWTFGDGGTSTLPSPSHTYAGDGTYLVCCTASNNCGDATTFCDTIIINTVSIVQAMPGYEITVAPNPIVDAAIVMVRNGGLQGSYSLEMMDLRGAIVLRIPGQLNVPLQLQAAALAQGMYVFRVLQDGLPIGTGKVIVE